MGMKIEMEQIQITGQYSDREVVQKILHGEIGLFEILIRRNNPFLYKIGRSYNYNHEITQDLMQDTFIDAYLHLSSFENRASFKTWIIKIMLNNCFKKKQKWEFKNVVSNELPDRKIPTLPNRTSANENLINMELREVIEKALKKIPLDYRMVFTLREINGLNISETAEALQLSEVNVKVKFHRAKKMLQKEITKTYSRDEIFEFNLIHCDPMVKRILSKIEQIDN